MYLASSIRVNNAINQGPTELMDVWNDNRSLVIAGFYGVGACQGVSAIFMLWAIFKLYLVIGRNFNLKELFSQKMITMHVITFLIYLLSLVTMYSFNTKWDSKDAKQQDKVYISTSICQILLTFVQLVLIYIFYGLGKAQSADENEQTRQDGQNLHEALVDEDARLMNHFANGNDQAAAGKRSQARKGLMGVKGLEPINIVKREYGTEYHKNSDNSAVAMPAIYAESSNKKGTAGSHGLNHYLGNTWPT